MWFFPKYRNAANTGPLVRPAAAIRGTRIAATERGEAETAYAEARAYYRRVAAEAVAP